MRSDARREMSDHFEAYLNDPALDDYQPDLPQGDFGSDNILTTPLQEVLHGC
jgi:hypothetical protein